MDYIIFWSLLCSILSATTVTRTVLDGSWEQNTKIAKSDKIILYISLSLSFVIVIQLMWIMSKHLPRRYLFLKNVSSTLQLALLVYLVVKVRNQQSPTNSYYAALLVIIFSSISLVLYLIDCIVSRCTTSQRLTSKQRTFLIVVLYTNIILSVGALIFKYVEDWSFTDSWFFCHVTGLTIGYGNMSPKTDLGKVIVCTYGWLLLAGAALSVLSLKELLDPSKVAQKRNLIFLISVSFVYVLLGALIFAFLEKWSYLDGLYFVCVTISTIGYGDKYPSRPITWEFWYLYVYASVAIYAFALGLITNGITKFMENRSVMQVNNH